MIPLQGANYSPACDWLAKDSTCRPSLTDIRQLVQNFGSQSSAHFIFQDGVDLFGNAEDGLIAYARQQSLFGNTNIVFNNPIGPTQKQQYLLESFLGKQDSPTLFVGVNNSVVKQLTAMGYQANQIGLESYVELNSFDLRGKEKKQLRHASNYADRQPCQVKELAWHQVDTRQVLDISETWRSHKAMSKKELRLLTRPPQFKDEWQVRKFYCLNGEQVLGYVFFEPYFDNGHVKGYCANIIRSLPDAVYNGVSDFIILQAIEQFRREGIQELSLGVSPLYKIQAEAGDRPVLRAALKAMYQYGNSLYAFKGLAYHKTRYRPQQEPWYLCSKNMNLGRILWTLSLALGVI